MIDDQHAEAPARASASTRLSGRLAPLLLTLFGALIVEDVVLGIVYRTLFNGTWEMNLARLYVSPLTLGALIPFAVLACLWGEWHRRAPRTAQRVLMAAWSVLVGAALALAPTGRTFAAPSVRFGLGLAAFVVSLAACGLLFPRLARQWSLRRGPVAAVAVLLAATCWSADAMLWPRRYPSLHGLLFVAQLMALALASTGIPRLGARARWVVIGLGLLTWPWSLHAARALHHADNLRLVLLEHAPLMGRGVAVAARIAPLPDGNTTASAPTLESTRALDWRAPSVFLITVDALRADHVGAYGYHRQTTPTLDAIAKESTLFEYAYCPTPHTSYSITSMMTGKYMHPLRALGLGGDSETWADLMRHYGFRTAAFYPPPVFFVDEDRFTRFRDQHLGFEYAKVEYAEKELRVQQVKDYLAKAKADQPLFMWVHLFDPHEPYVWHPEHPFVDEGGLHPTPIDAYDSEIAEADETIARLVQLFDEARPDHVLMITADHGEEFGEHGGRYHGSSAYEEQVRVPLLVRGPGVLPHRVKAPVQSIDLLPTYLSAFGSPRPPRLRGRDLGPELTGKRDDLGFAFAESANLAMVAEGTQRLVCRRAEAACALYDVSVDPLQQRDIGSTLPDRVKTLRGLWRRTEVDHGRLEGDRGASLPEALRRGLQGDRTAAPEVSALLDDVDVKLRREAARVLVRLGSAEVEPQLERAITRETDDETRGLCAAALTRIQRKVHPQILPLLTSSGITLSNPEARRLAAIVLAEQGNDEGLSVLIAAIDARAHLDEVEALEVIDALALLKSKRATASLIDALDDVRLRPRIAKLLGELDDPAARGPLLEVFREERYLQARAVEAQALLDLGAGKELWEPLTRYAGMPEPIADAVQLARRAGLLSSARGGAVVGDKLVWSGRVARPMGEGLRLLVRLAAPGTLQGTADGAELGFRGDPSSKLTELPPREGKLPPTLELALRADVPIEAFWVVPLHPELPPPAAEEWDGGAPDAQ